MLTKTFHEPLEMCKMPKLEKPSSKKKRTFQEMLFLDATDEKMNWENWIFVNAEVMLNINSSVSVLGSVIKKTKENVYIKIDENEDAQYSNKNYKLHITKQQKLEKINQMEVECKMQNVKHFESVTIIKQNNMKKKAKTIDIPREKNLVKRRSKRLALKKIKLKDSSDEEFQLSINEFASSSEDEMKNKKRKRKKRKSQFWSKEETSALIHGIATYHHHFHAKRGLNGVWAHILKDKKYGQILRKRSNLQLKDKWKHLQLTWKRSYSEK